MGVKDLWPILGPVKQHRPLKELEGEVLAVDLSIWICEVQGMKQLKGVQKPHLRNLFFRVSHLLRLGVKLVFVVEGDAPNLKLDTLRMRQQALKGSRSLKGPSSGKRGGHFKAVLRECCTLLDSLGVPHIQAKGEAEALCALLNKLKLVDGCITDDGDAFLFGATRVYRNFTMNSKDPHVELYESEIIESNLGLNREKLVALGLLLGCDYLPKGVPGIGKETAKTFLSSSQGQAVLQKFRDWSNGTPPSDGDMAVWKKASCCPGFPFEKVIEEFFTVKDKVRPRKFGWNRPQIRQFQDFTVQKLEWVEEYSLEKIVPLLTLWSLRNHGDPKQLIPHRVIKSRVKQGEPCVEVEWHKEGSDTADYHVTIETQDLFEACYPHLIQEYQESKSKPKKAKDSGRTNKENIDPTTSHRTTPDSIASQKYDHKLLTSEENDPTSLASQETKQKQVTSLKATQQSAKSVKNGPKPAMARKAEQKYVPPDKTIQGPKEDDLSWRLAACEIKDTTGSEAKPVSSTHHPLNQRGSEPERLQTETAVGALPSFIQTDDVITLSDGEDELLPLSQRLMRNKSTKNGPPAERNRPVRAEQADEYQHQSHDPIPANQKSRHETLSNDHEEYHDSANRMSDMDHVASTMKSLSSNKASISVRNENFSAVGTPQTTAENKAISNLKNETSTPMNDAGTNPIRVPSPSAPLSKPPVLTSSPHTSSQAWALDSSLDITLFDLRHDVTEIKDVVFDVTQRSSIKPTLGFSATAASPSKHTATRHPGNVISQGHCSSQDGTIPQLGVPARLAAHGSQPPSFDISPFTHPPPSQDVASTPAHRQRLASRDTGQKSEGMSSDKNTNFDWSNGKSRTSQLDFIPGKLCSTSGTLTPHRHISPLFGGNERSRELGSEVTSHPPHERSMNDSVYSNYGNFSLGFLSLDGSKLEPTPMTPGASSGSLVKGSIMHEHRPGVIVSTLVKARSDSPVVKETLVVRATATDSNIRVLNSSQCQDFKPSRIKDQCPVNDFSADLDNEEMGTTEAEDRMKENLELLVQESFNELSHDLSTASLHSDSLLEETRDAFGAMSLVERLKMKLGSKSQEKKALSSLTLR